MELDQRLNELRQMWPDLQWQNARLIECDHDVVILDKSLVFRFLCENLEHEPLEREIQFLDRLRSRATIPVPDYTYIDEAYQVAGYPHIPGEPLDLSCWDGLTRDQRREIAVGVAKILNAIHGFPISEAEELGIRRGNTPREAVKDSLAFYNRIKRPGFLTEEEMKYCDDIARSIGQANLYAEMPQCVIHGDIEYPHILHDGERLTGIIDFGDVLIGDPARDFGRLWELGEGFVDDVLAHYHYHHGSENLKQRSHWFGLGNALGMMDWGTRSHHQEAWERGYHFFPEGVSSPNRVMGLSK